MFTDVQEIDRLESGNFLEKSGIVVGVEEGNGGRLRLET